ncbi:hypothetical protein LTS08_002528 [Lithohypha guttulata]|nr:hypothetical protein LTS08_002528 [Lithohypha guttulata]
MFGDHSPHFREPEWLFSGNLEDQLSYLKGFRDARGTLYWLTFDTHHLLVEGKPHRRLEYIDQYDEDHLQECLEKQTRLFTAYSAWLMGLNALCARSVTGLNERQVAQLRLTHVVSVVWLSTCLSRDEGSCDSYIGHFQHALDQAAKVLGHGVPQIQFEQGVIPPLYFTALKCRDLVIRQQALSLLQKAPSREGLWRRDEAVRVARRVIDLETSNSHIASEGNIFQSARICEAKIKYTDEVGTYVKFYSKLVGRQSSALNITISMTLGTSSTCEPALLPATFLKDDDVDRTVSYVRSALSFAASFLKAHVKDAKIR